MVASYHYSTLALTRETVGPRATDPRQPTGAHSTLALTRETVGPRATDPRQPTGAHSTLALTRDTVGPSTLAVGPSAHFFSLISTAEKSSPSPARGLAALLQSLLFMVHPDSGCTGSVTNDRSRLINIRPCSESFLDANGKKAVADGIGEMPVIFATLGQRHTLVTFTNVRCVPLFKYTLLSVKQMWREQQISSKFDDALCLDLPASMGGQRLQFSTDRELPTLRALSCAVASAVTGQQISLPAVHSPPPMTPAVPPAAATRTVPPPPPLDGISPRALPAADDPSATGSSHAHRGRPPLDGISPRAGARHLRAHPPPAPVVVDGGAGRAALARLTGR